MTKDEARKELAENLMLLAEALLDDDRAGQYQNDLEKGELKITSVLGNSTTVIAVKSWNYKELEEKEAEDEWDEYFD